MHSRYSPGERKGVIDVFIANTGQRGPFDDECYYFLITTKANYCDQG